MREPVSIVMKSVKVYHKACKLGALLAGCWFMLVCGLVCSPNQAEAEETRAGSSCAQYSCERGDPEVPLPPVIPPSSPPPETSTLPEDVTPPSVSSPMPEDGFSEASASPSSGEGSDEGFWRTETPAEDQYWPGSVPSDAPPTGWDRSAPAGVSSLTAEEADEEQPPPDSEEGDIWNPPKEPANNGTYQGLKHSDCYDDRDRPDLYCGLGDRVPADYECVVFYGTKYGTVRACAPADEINYSNGRSYFCLLDARLYDAKGDYIGQANTCPKEIEHECGNHHCGMPVPEDWVCRKEIYRHGDFYGGREATVYRCAGPEFEEFFDNYEVCRDKPKNYPIATLYDERIRPIVQFRCGHYGGGDGELGAWTSMEADQAEGPAGSREVDAEAEEDSSLKGGGPEYLESSGGERSAPTLLRFFEGGRSDIAPASSMARSDAIGAILAAIVQESKAASSEPRLEWGSIVEPDSTKTVEPALPPRYRGGARGLVSVGLPDVSNLWWYFHRKASADSPTDSLQQVGPVPDTQSNPDKLVSTKEFGKVAPSWAAPTFRGTGGVTQLEPFSTRSVRVAGVVAGLACCGSLGLLLATRSRRRRDFVSKKLSR